MMITRSAVRSANKTSPNLRLDPPKGEDQPQDLTSEVFVYGRPHPDGSEEPSLMSTINFDNLLGRAFLLPMDEMERGRELPYLIISILLINLKFSEKPFPQDITNSPGKMENPTLQIFSANIGSLQTYSLSSSLYSSGRRTHMSSLLRKSGVAEFHPQKGGL